MAGLMDTCLAPALSLTLSGIGEVLSQRARELNARWAFVSWKDWHRLSSASGSGFALTPALVNRVDWQPTFPLALRERAAPHPAANFSS